jgi:UDP-N-acetylglucosamine--N-acetylmuramyl-(pentapeptide) pyrophosphoryl-undecaprenol N-acetylglucosamine transferase
MRKESETFVLAGGGTGGHVFPAVAIARAIVRRRPTARVLFIGTARGIEAVIAPREGFPIEFITASGFVGRGFRAKARSIRDLALGIFQSRRILARERAAAVVGVGGYASLPVLAAARWSGVPSIIQEQNSIPGLANRVGARLALASAAGFEEARARFPGRCVWTGNPVREEFFRVPPVGTPGRRVFLFGGSQGARVLNRALVEAAPRLAAAGVEVFAQTGEREADSVRASVAAHGIAVVPFLPDIWNAMARADLVVCRSGALTLAELCAAGRPSLLVPFAAATHRHQEHNACTLERAGAAVVVPEYELTGDILVARVEELLADPARLRRMGEAARSLARPGADDPIVDLLFEVAGIAA